MEPRATTNYADEQIKARKLEPVKKSGKERYQMLNDEFDDEPMDYLKRESILDYFDDRED
jgi:hypothetical protein